ncbi:MAG: SDR family oxidoreductase [Rhodobacter sp.]|nr:SDR family oxidoreductase [Rhodobacter sp.]
MTEHGRLVILGASGGIGRVLTACAIGKGWEVIALDLPATLDACPPPAEVASAAVDLHDPISVETAFAAIGKIDGFVNLAGYMSQIQPLINTSLDAFDDVVAGNLRGAFIAAKAALPHLAKNRGSIVNVASGLGAHARPGFGPYSAAKAGMISLTKTLALEAAPEIRVNAVGPSAIDTDFLSGGAGRERRAKAPINLDAIADATPLKRIATPEDVVGPILFLLSEEARFMTGQTLWVNGGAFMP